MACRHTVSVSTSSSQDLSHLCLLFLQRHQSDGISPTLTSSQLNHVYKDPISEYSHIHRYQKLEIRHVFCGTQSNLYRNWMILEMSTAAASQPHWSSAPGSQESILKDHLSSHAHPPSPHPYLHPLTCSRAWTAAQGHVGSAPEVTPKVRRSSKWRRRERELCFWDGKLKSWFLWFAVMSKLNKNQLNLKAFKICYLIKFFILKKVLYHPLFDYPDRKKKILLSTKRKKSFW